MVSSMEKKIYLTSKQQEAISEIDHNLQIIAKTMYCTNIHSFNIS